MLSCSVRVMPKRSENRTVTLGLLLVVVLGCRGGRDVVAPYTAPVKPTTAEFAAATEAWRWKMPVTAEPLLITALGDVFVLIDGRVLYLDTGSGELIDIARSTAEWERMLRDSTNVVRWFHPDFVTRLQQHHSPLKEPYVYSPAVPPILNGELTAENYTPLRWDAHLHVMGQIHRQVTGSPPTR